MIPEDQQDALLAKIDAQYLGGDQEAGTPSPVNGAPAGPSYKDIVGTKKAGDASPPSSAARAPALCLKDMIKNPNKSWADSRDSDEDEDEAPRLAPPTAAPAATVTTNGKDVV